MLTAGRTIGRALEDAAQGTAGFWHLDERGDGRFVPYSELLDTARHVAGALHDAGFGPGSRVGIAVGPTESFARTFFGAILAGCIVTPLAEANVLRDAGGFVDQLIASLASAQVDLLIADPRTAALVKSGPVERNCEVAVICVDEALDTETVRRARARLRRAERGGGPPRARSRGLGQSPI